MAGTAAHLVDRVGPERHTRQWVLSLGMSTEPPVITPPRGPAEPQLDWHW